MRSEKLVSIALACFISVYLVIFHPSSQQVKNFPGTWFDRLSTTAAYEVSSRNPELEGYQILPADNIWNVHVQSLPADENSNAYIQTISAGNHVIQTSDPESGRQRTVIQSEFHTMA
jgi:hypothetical protein